MTRRRSSGKTDYGRFPEPKLLCPTHVARAGAKGAQKHNPEGLGEARAHDGMLIPYSFNEEQCVMKKSAGGRPAKSFVL